MPINKINVEQFKCHCVNMSDGESPSQNDLDLSDVRVCKICCEQETEEICNDCINIKCSCKKSEIELCSNCLQSVLFCLCSGKIARIDSFNSKKGQGCHVKEGEFQPQFLTNNSLSHKGSGMTKCTDAWGSSSNPHEIHAEASSRIACESSSSN